MLAAIAATALSASLWRVSLGHRFLPGLFTVIGVPLSVAVFGLLDGWVRLPVRHWITAATLVCAHIVLSVPVRPGPLYYVGTHLFRIDHLMHVAAGGLVTSIGWYVLVSRVPAIRGAPVVRAAASVAVALAFGAIKETTDFLSVLASGLRHDTFDSWADTGANVLGGLVVAAWHWRHPIRIWQSR
jgi:hypothetical protein